MQQGQELPIQRLRESLAQTYTIDRELGRGGMSAVFLAQDCKHERSVAIKVLNPELAASLGPERFLQEINPVTKTNTFIGQDTAPLQRFDDVCFSSRNRAALIGVFYSQNKISSAFY